MKVWKRFAAGLACVGLMHLVLADFAAAGDTRWHPISAEAYVRNLGVGTAIQVALTSGEKVQGPISRVSEQGFFVDVSERADFEVRYTRIQDMKAVGLEFESDDPDPDAARRVVTGLEGSHVMVRTGEGELRGHIESVGTESFMLRVDEREDLAEIAYRDVLKVGENLSAGATIAIVVGVVVAAVVVVALAADDEVVDALQGN